ncbi:nucleotidyltransferase [Sinorhizobium medicae]|nr:nucleotidyltransferase [Sinorhizobium medicae]MDX0580832.1 nucleotidyltransferase [Sinorhizobium medicae]MDX0784092.1 nucleotidyltransferase [Sinorhizobium medicae]
MRPEIRDKGDDNSNAVVYPDKMSGIEEHLRAVLFSHWVDTSINSPVRAVQETLDPALRKWGSQYIVDIRPSGSFAKGTAVHGGTDIDVFVSLASTLIVPLASIYDTLFNALTQASFTTRRQNVSIGTAINGWRVDVTPARRQDQHGNYHSLWSNKTGSWLQTNVNEHCRVVSGSGRLDEIRLIKIWRNGFGLDWPSFYLELFTIDALLGARVGNLQQNIVTVLRAVADKIGSRRLIDPANTNNVVSDTLTAQGKASLSSAAHSALNSRWNVVFK